MFIDLLLKNASIEFEYDKAKNIVTIELVNADYYTRREMNIVIGYEDGSYDTFDCENIATGGSHAIPIEKAKNIVALNFVKKGTEQVDDRERLSMSEVGYRFQALREKMRLTQTQLANLSGLRQGRISDMETAKKKMCTFSVIALTKALGVTLDDIGYLSVQEFDKKFEIERESKPHPMLARIFTGTEAPPV